MTPPKPTKLQTIWSMCNNCNCFVLTKERDTHQCPTPTDKWTNAFISNDKLYSFFDVSSKERLTGVDENELDNFVFLSQSVIQLCEFKIGDPVLININDTNVAPIVRIVWPTCEKAVSSVLLTKNGLDAAFGALTHKHVRVEAIRTIKTAQTVILELIKPPKNMDYYSDIIKRLSSSYLNKFVCVGNKISVLYYGKVLYLNIIDIKWQDGETNEAELNLAQLSLSDIINVFQIVTNTQIIINKQDDLKNKQISLKTAPKLGGLSEIETTILKYINSFFKSNKTDVIIKSVLLYGASGTGKTSLAIKIANNTLTLFKNADTIFIQSCNIYSQYAGEAEQHLKAMFNEALIKNLCIIVLDDIDLLCPHRNTKPSEQEKRVIATLTDILDNLSNKIFIIATSNKPDSIDTSLRRFGRLDLEIEIPVPTESARREILTNIFNYNKNENFKSDELRELASITPGYVGSDLMLAYATASASKNVLITLDDLKLALKKVKPSAMRDIQIESPDVHWSDIGGQETLKLKLQQAIEWPLEHPEIFYRMGIRPPRGILMYGPPGCSKTMIAKALASETKLNFLSIKGPELFNKYVGESEKAVRDLFKRARQAAPSIVFFDEVDAISGERSTSSGISNSVQERVLAQLLTELDGVTALGAVTVVAATNRPDRIDKALLRPGRLDRIIYVPLPDATTRQAIFKLKTSKMPTVQLNINNLVERTDGYSGAEVEAVCNEAAMKALEEDINATEIHMSHFEYALTAITPRTPASLIQIYENYSKS